KVIAGKQWGPENRQPLFWPASAKARHDKTVARKGTRRKLRSWLVPNRPEISVIRPSTIERMQRNLAKCRVRKPLRTKNLGSCITGIEASHVFDRTYACCLQLSERYLQVEVLLHPARQFHPIEREERAVPFLHHSTKWFKIGNCR